MPISRPASAVQWARAFVLPALGRVSRAVDATAGNGHDTLFLAENVGPGGHVYALDIQEEALEKTRARIEAAGLKDRVTLLLRGHQDLDRLVEAPVDAVMFNLGYLPGSDRTVTTGPETTRDGISAALRILRPGGRLSVVAYTGHPGAREEAVAVAGLMGGLDLKEFNVQKMVFWNSRGDSPELYFATRAGEDNG
ncbi:MAG: class I SAM-dependent methyltransferase [Peptococcaceae bacterium]|nr:class I SAM-dependent methyltransferase [Peptococcaceae bacterium]